MAASRFVAFPTYAGLAPDQGPRNLPIKGLALTANTSQTIDLFKEEAMKEIGFIQSVYIDNSNNTGYLTLVSLVILQVITVPPGWQGWYRFDSIDQTQFTIVSGAAASVDLIFSNVPCAQCCWPANANAFKSTVAIDQTTPGTTNLVSSKGVGNSNIATNQ